MRALTENQRHIYMYLIVHKNKYPDKPCKVPLNPSKRSVSGTKAYLNALKRLEERKLVKVTRSGPCYTDWIIDLCSEPNPVNRTSLVFS